MRSRWIVLAGMLVLAAIIGGIATWKHLGSRHTPVAAITATSPARTPTSIRGEGRVVTASGGLVTVGAELTGTLDRVMVKEGTVVRAGETIATFRVGEQAAAVYEANAHAREASITARSLAEEAKQTKALVEGGSLPRAALRKIKSERDAARARRAAAGATLSRLAVTASRAKIVAPISGTVIQRKVEPGETVMLGTPLFVIADLSQLRVEAEIDEFDAARVRATMKAEVKVDGSDQSAMKGAVESIGFVITPRGIRPQDPARPLDAQVLKVKITLDRPEIPLKLGQRVSVTLVDGDTT